MLDGEGEPPIQFSLPRKKCSEIAPELKRMRDKLPLQDDSSEVVPKMPPVFQHRYHILKVRGLRTIMQYSLYGDGIFNSLL